MRIIPLLPLLALSLNLSFAQTAKDSLWGIWANAARGDSVRLKAIQDLAWSLMYSSPDSTELLARIELAYAQKINDRRWEGKAHNTLAGSYHVRSNYPAALDAYQKALAALEQAKDLKGVAAVVNNIGLIYRERGNSPKALAYYQRYLEIGASLKNNDILSAAYNNLGTLYSDQGIYDKALEYYNKGLALADTLGDKYGMAIGFNNIGSVYFTQKMFADALEKYETSLQLRKALNDLRGVGLMYNNIGLIYKDQRNYFKALEYFRKAVEIQEQLGDKSGLSSTYYSIGTLYTDQKAHVEAIGWCSKAYTVSEEIGAVRPARNACHCLYESFVGMGKKAQALEWLEKHMRLNDSLQKEETSRQLAQLEFEKAILTDSLQREDEKQKIRLSFQADLARRTQARNLILAVATAVLFLALVFMSRMLYFQKRSEKLHTRTQMLEKQQLIHEIDLLKTQVNPHFLFNSLSILSSLVHRNPHLSEQFIDQLSRSYRYVLEQKDQALVTLRTELDFIRSYCFLLKIRFDNKFDMLCQLPEEALEKYKIAPLTLQLLIENAVKHNRMSAQEPLLVEVTLEGECLKVANALRPRPQHQKSTGTGLNNIINRYALLTDKKVWAGESNGQFVVKVPLV